MKKKWPRLLALVCFFSVLMTSLPAIAGSGPDHEPYIRVGLLINQSNVTVSADIDYALINKESRQILGNFKAKDKITVSIQNETLAVNGLSTGAEKLAVVLTQAGVGENYLRINNRRYRGDIDLHRTAEGTGITVVNTLPVEQYLYGIIAKEISPAWHLEAIKAQAVAARTYALYGFNKHKDDGYDVCATVHCQVYGGRESEAPQAIKAVNDTRGLVLMYDGKLIPAYFHSSSGGYTENSENVWGTSQPFLRGVADYDQSGPYFKWEKALSSAELAILLEEAGYKLGKLKAIELSPLVQAPVSAEDRGISGRVKALRMVGSQGSVIITGAKFRSILGLHSTLFDIGVAVPDQKSVEYSNIGSFSSSFYKTAPVDVQPVQEKMNSLYRENTQQLKGLPDETVIITGYGWGHGVGLSQWGAKAMAEGSPPGDTTYFITILKHYYQGTDVYKAY